jgi:short-subunit dehydrogenase involved in D-alanine esterification of teichoic acids
MKTSGHTVLITGGASGIGFAIAKRFVLAGNKVVLVGRSQTNLDKALEALALISRAAYGLADSEQIQTYAADISLPSECANLVATYPNITVLVNNAGVQFNHDFEDFTAAEIEQEMAINLMAPTRLCHAYLSLMLKQPEAAIVNVTSALAIVHKQNAPVYAASKSGLRALTKVLQWQNEATSVRVFDVVPPLVETAMTAGRGKGKISPDVLAAEFFTAFAKNQLTIYIGKAKILNLLARFVPALAERIIRKS